MRAETKLEMVERHVREGRKHVAQQSALIARLRAYGLLTEEPENLLGIFEDVQRLHEAHLRRLRAST